MSGELLSGAPQAPPARSAVTDAFRAVVERFADRPALEADGVTLTYGELDRLSSRVANGLVERGGKEPAAFVATLEPASVALMLGTLKAGRVCVPLDPRDPTEQLRRVRDHMGAIMLAPERLDELLSDRDDDPGLPIDPGGPSLVYFTSGSTGRPKGTVKAHRELLWAPVAYGIEERDRFAMILPLSFAASITPVFGTLLAGAAGCLFDPVRRTMGELAEWIGPASVTVIKTAPSVLRAIAAAMEERGLTAPSVRLAVVAGEPLLGSGLGLVRRVLPAAAVTNLYGSTEAGYIAATTIAPGEPVDPGPVHFREVFPWQTLEIVDESGRAVTAGEPGEIVVRGHDLALGYWDDPDETAARFTFERDGSRSIRTGDCGRRREDGLLEHLGRTDLNVKVNGQMVDPQAVERALAALPSVREAVVSPVASESAGTRLVAHVLPQEGLRPSARELRLGLAERLPPFMIPCAFFRVDGIPRNARGKVDRAVLRELAAAAAPVEVAYTAPRDRHERAVADVVREALAADRVGAHDDVFELGADSLSAAELLVAIEERLGVSLGAGDLVEAPTVELLARRIVAGSDPAGRTIVPVHAGGSGAPFFCVTGGGGNVLTLRRLAVRLGRPTYSFVPRGFDRRALPDRSVERAAVRYVTALRTVRPAGPYLVGGYSFGGLVAVEIARRLRAAGETVALLVLLDPASEEPTYAGRIRRLAAGREASPAAVAHELARRGAIWVRHTFGVATAGLVAREPAQQRLVFSRLSRRMGHRYGLEPYEGPALLVRTAAWRDVDDLDVQGLLTGELQIEDVPGGHGSMLREPHVATLASVLGPALAAADEQ